jgi:ELWxxDGT repeat protein
VVLEMTAGVLLLATMVAPARATEPFMVKDINPFGNSQPWYMTGVGNQVFMNADDGVHGQELWVSDGTEFGTRLVKDIVPGIDGFVPSQLRGTGNRVFFVGDDNIHGFEFWVSDGTEAGTQLLKDIDPATDGNPPEVCGLLPPKVGTVGNMFFFVWDDGINGDELWRSDGTPSGTVLVKDILPGPSGSSVSLITDFNGRAVFDALTDEFGSEPWISNGRKEGTAMIKDINPVGHSWALWYTTVGNRVFFQGDDFTDQGVELWVTDGTEAGTFLVKDINPGPNWSSPTAFAAVGDMVFFSAFEPTFGRELWKSDGTEAGTVMIKDINPAGSSGIPEKMVVGDTFFFSGFDGVNGRELWRSDGSETGTYMVKDINPTGSSNIQYMVNAYGTLYFSADDGVNGRELWKSDGTEAGTVMVGEVFPGPESGLGLNNVDLTLAGDFVFFKGYDGIHGVELWAMDVVEPITEGKIPTVSHWGLVVLGLLTLTAGSVLLRRGRVVMGVLAMTLCVGAGFALAQRPTNTPAASSVPGATGGLPTSAEVAQPSNVRRPDGSGQAPGRTLRDATVATETTTIESAAPRAAEVSPVWRGASSSGQPTVRIKINVLDLRAGIRQVDRQIQMLRRIFGLAGVEVKVTLQMIDNNELGNERHPIGSESQAKQTMNTYLDRPQKLLNVFVANHEVDADRDGQADRSHAYTLAAPSGGEPRAGLMVHWKEVADETATFVHSIVHFVGLEGPRGAQAGAWLQRHGVHEGCLVCLARGER